MNILFQINLDAETIKMIILTEGKKMINLP